MQQPFALFDFDDTVSRGDSVVPFVRFCANNGYAPRKHAFRAGMKYIGTFFGKCSVEEAKQFAHSFLAGKTQEETREIAHEFWQKVLVKRLFPSAVAEMRRLRDAGCRVLIVSASVSAYMDVLPEYLPADGVISTVCGVDENGCLTGYLGENCRGLQKPPRIAEYLAANHQLLDYEGSYSFGDSSGDEPMLRLTAHPTLVNPSKKLRAALPHAAVVHWKSES